MSSETSAEIPTREIRASRPRPDAAALRASYLDLLKLALCDLAGAGTLTISWTGDRRVFSRELTGEDQYRWRADGRDWPLNALTMTGLQRLDDLQTCVETVVNDGVPGDLIEAGSWRGGSSILMRATLDALGADERTVWVADSFQGFPVPEANGVSEDRELETDMSGLDYLAPSLEQVKGYFARFGCEHGVNFVPGFFEETMAGLRGREWSVVRLDGDTYKATRLTLEALYPGLAVGGFLVSDDYAFLPACRRAIDDFREEHGIAEPIEQIDYNGARWRRERAEPDQPDEEAAAPAPTSAGRPRAVSQRTVAAIPTGRELQLGDEVAELRARLAAAEAQLEALKSSPFAGPSAWWARRRTKPGA
jgi:O-methyltransferase